MNIETPASGHPANEASPGASVAAPGSASETSINTTHAAPADGSSTSPSATHTARLKRPWLWLPAPAAHALSPYFLRAHGAAFSPVTYEWRPRVWRGLRFANPLGLAGGVDKDATTVRGWWTLGAGFIEIGTVTPLPQGPNPGRIMGRDLAQNALWNKMGFPSRGAEAVAAQLEKLPRPYHTPVFINIGKNRVTANENAAQDYITCLERLYRHADAFVINISSPNTKGLRDLLKPENLHAFLAPIRSARDRIAATAVATARAAGGAGSSATSGPGTVPHATPLLLKLSPDIDDTDLNSALDVSHELGIDGYIVSNTTLHREPQSPFPAEGGVSGAPLARLSKAMLCKTLFRLGARREGKLVVSAGGVMSAADVRERLDMGADLVQVYSALIFSGPRFFRDVAHAQDQGTSARP